MQCKTNIGIKTMFSKIIDLKDLYGFSIKLPQQLKPEKFLLVSQLVKIYF